MAGAGVYAAVLLLSLAVTTIAVLGAALGSSGEASVVPDNPFIPQNAMPSPWSILFSVAAQLPALAMFGSLGGAMDADLGMFGQMNIAMTVSFLPLLVMVAVIVFAALAGKYAQKSIPSATALDRLAQSIITGIVVSLLLNVVAAIAALRIPVGDGVGISLNAVNFASVFMTFAVAAAASYWGRRKRGIPRTAKAAFAFFLVRDAGRTVAIHVGAFLLVAVPVSIVVLGIKGGVGAVLSALIWAPTLGLILLGLGHLAAVGAITAGGMGAAGATVSKHEFGYGIDGSFADAGLPIWAGWLLVLLVLLSLTAASIHWYLRRGGQRARGVFGWVALPVAFLMLGILLLWLTGVKAEVTTPLGGGGAAAGFAWWTPFLFALWGVGAEALSRCVAPHLAPLLPAALVGRIQRWPSVPFPAGAATAPAAGVPSGAPAGAGLAGPDAGAAAPQAAAAFPAGGVTVEHKPLSKKAKRNWIVGAGAAGLVVVLAVGGSIAVGVVKGANGPEAVVEDYLEALVAGDAVRAMEISQASVPNDQRLLLTNEIYAKATNRIDGFTVGKSTVKGNTATVSVEVTQNGQRLENTVTLSKKNPTFFNDNWSMANSRASLGVSIQGTGTLRFSAAEGAKAVLVNGVEVSLENAAGRLDGYYELPAYAGSYELELATDSKYLDSNKVPAMVSIDARSSLDRARLEVQPNEAFETEAAKQVGDYLNACAAQTVVKPVDCPMNAYAYGDTRNVVWKITKEPTLRISSNYDGAWRFSSDEFGEATATFQEKSRFSSKDEWEDESYDDRFYLYGTITIDDGGKLAVTFKD